MTNVKAIVNRYMSHAAETYVCHVHQIDVMFAHYTFFISRGNKVQSVRRRSCSCSASSSSPKPCCLLLLLEAAASSCTGKAALYYVPATIKFVRVYNNVQPI